MSRYLNKKDFIGNLQYNILFSLVCAEFKWDYMKDPLFSSLFIFCFYLTSPISKGFEVARRAENIWSYEYWVNNTCMVWNKISKCVHTFYSKYRNVQYLRIMLTIICVGHSANYCIDCLENAVTYDLYKKLCRLVKLLSWHLKHVTEEAYDLDKHHKGNSNISTVCLTNGNISMRCKLYKRITL